MSTWTGKRFANVFAYGAKSNGKRISTTQHVVTKQVIDPDSNGARGRWRTAASMQRPLLAKQVRARNSADPQNASVPLCTYQRVDAGAGIKSDTQFGASFRPGTGTEFPALGADHNQVRHCCCCPRATPGVWRRTRSKRVSLC